MNDFTKDELDGIKNIILHARDDYPVMHSDRELTEILKKLQSLIDNFPKCDHRSSNNHYNEQRQQVNYYSDIYRCRHCDILFKFTFENGQCVGSEELE
jgi:HEPN domain-containing protein